MLFKKLITSLSVILCKPIFSQAMPSNLSCKLYGQHGSAQMQSQIVTQGGKTTTYLVFNKPIAWYQDVNRFELVYSSGYRPSHPITLVANAVSANRVPQTVQIALAVPIASDPSVRYGKVRTGDFVGKWDKATGKYKDYEIQCYNF